MNPLLINPATARAEAARISSQYGFTDNEGTGSMEADAFRHAVWQATMSSTDLVGETRAKILGDSNEILGDLVRPTPVTDRNMDLWNNREGRNIGIEAKQKGWTDQQLYMTR